MSSGQSRSATLLNMTDTQLVKLAGEHWVCSAMAQYGWAAALTRDGLARSDLLAVHTASGRMVEVQVKASSPCAEANWPLGTKAELPARSEGEWFVLVVLHNSPAEAPRAYVVPRDHVAAATWISHQSWLTDPSVPPGKRTAQHKSARVKESVLAPYRDRWDLLTESTSKAPVLLPTDYRGYALMDRVGLPVEHPWLKKLPSW
jgi:hypothetical protein